MPILDVEIALRPGEALAPSLAARLADAIGEALGAPAGKVWLRLRELPDGRYAENGQGGERFFPVFVTFSAKTLPEGADLEAKVAAITRAVARLADRPAGNVHVTIEPGLRGRIAFGGKLQA